MHGHMNVRLQKRKVELGDEHPRCNHNYLFIYLIIYLVLHVLAVKYFTISLILNVFPVVLTF